MFEFLAIAFVTYLMLNRKKRRKKPRGLDAELKELVENSSDPTGIGLDIKRYLLSVIDDDKNDREKFSDSQITEAQRILDRAGPAAFYWMTEICSQLTFLAAAQINKIPTNVDAELNGSATPEDIVRIVVQP